MDTSLWGTPQLLRYLLHHIWLVISFHLCRKRHRPILFPLQPSDAHTKALEPYYLLEGEFQESSEKIMLYEYGYIVDYWRIVIHMVTDFAFHCT